MQDIYNLYQINGKTLELSEKQREIFYSIIDLAHPRVQIIAPTQYGKSLTVACAILASAVSMGEKWVVLAPTEKKAEIIMQYVIEHTFDNEMFLNALDIDPNFPLDRLRRERSRTHLTYKGGGGVMILTLDARNGKRSLEAAMGFGGNRIILDESSLIDDPLYATVKRMLGGYEYQDTFLLEIGNPFYRNHFYRTWHDPLYHRLFIDYKTGLSEGRYSPEFIDEMRREAFFDVFYECKFPDEESIDARGYRNLITNEQLEAAFSDHIEAGSSATLDMRLGVDIGGGGDFNVYCIRTNKCAWIEGKNRSNDTMTNVNEVRNIIEKYHIKPSNVFIDDIGIGRGVTDRLRELDIMVTGVSVGGVPSDKTKYKNIKAENLWHMRDWILNTGNLGRDESFRQITWIKYKVDSDRLIMIEPKDELVQRTGKSPDYADALALTFSVPSAEPDIMFA